MTRTALSDNGKLANQIARLQAIVVKRTKETNVAHAPHHPEKPFKFSQIHSKRGNMRNGGCSAVIVNIHRMFPKGRHTMNAKMMNHLKDLGITLSL